MRLIVFFKKIFNAIRNLNNFEKILKKNLLVNQYQQSSVVSSRCGVEAYKSDTENLVVSLTTYSKRIFSVHLTIESLLNQTQKPNKLILWLADDEFNDNNLPLVIAKQKERGLTVNFCKDIKSYKKLIPTLNDYANDAIVTVDDDVIYPYDFLEKLYRTYLSAPDCVCYYRGHKMKFLNVNTLAPYANWLHCWEGVEKEIDVLPTGIGGVLYPPKCFHQDITNDSLFMKLAPHGDDIWFKAMTLLNGVQTKKVVTMLPFSEEFIDIDGTQDIGLWKKNVGGGRNDEQINAVFEYYKNDFNSLFSLRDK
ncbi:glycosyltransferase family A protein [Aeromonas caviae]